MKQRPPFPHQVREVENAWIPLSDGTRLAARYWLPEEALAKPVPAILEYIPYRKRDHTRERDERTHRYFAGHGYCAIRVDLRGSGDSEGLLLGEYLPQEQDDALEVIAWIARQPWCNGRVGMMGKSWGGFSALQVAARQPPALQCIITFYSTVDRYADDVHYMGGCLLTMNPEWSFTMFCRNAQPPDPRYVGSRWRDLWRQRLEANTPWILTWLKHQQRDAYWKHGSVCEDYGAIKCPVYAIGGWADAYTNAVPRLLEGLTVPCKGLIGPWGHHYPHLASPGPQMDFLQEGLRWWDHWLKDVETGIMEEPAYRVWMQDSIAPSVHHSERPGRWVAEPSWPSPRIAPRGYVLNVEGLETSARAERALILSCRQTVGLSSLHWNNKGAADGSPEDPDDQRIDDSRSLIFDSTPLREPLEILGAPTLTLDLSIDRSVAFICVRLCEVTTEGASTRITYGLMNLALDPAGERPTSASVGERRQVPVTLKHVAHSFAPGSRIRISISTAFWPIVWPSPEPVTLTLFAGVSTLQLPVRTPHPADADLPGFASPISLSSAPLTVLRPSARRLVRLERDVGSNRYTLIDVKDAGLRRIDEDGWVFGGRSKVRRSIVEGDPLSACMSFEGNFEFRRAGDLDVSIRATAFFRADHDAFIIDASLDVLDDGRPFFERRWRERVRRETV